MNKEKKEEFSHLMRRARQLNDEFFSKFKLHVSLSAYITVDKNTEVEAFLNVHTFNLKNFKDWGAVITENIAGKSFLKEVKYDLEKRKVRII